MYSFRSVYFDRPIQSGRVLDIFQPDRESVPKQKVALFFVHGGGWRGGSRAIFHLIMEDFVNRGYVCGSTDYRLSGVHLPEQMTDVRCGYQLFQQELRAMGEDVPVVVFGSSAGAHLAGLLGIAQPGEVGDAELPDWQGPVAVINQAFPTRFHPWEDMFPPIVASMQSIAGVALDSGDPRIGKYSPVNYIKATSPAFLLIEAGDEHMFRLEHSREFCQKLTEVGVRAELEVVPDCEHGFYYALTRKCQQAAHQRILQFLDY